MADQVPAVGQFPERFALLRAVARVGGEGFNRERRASGYAIIQTSAPSALLDRPRALIVALLIMVNGCGRRGRRVCASGAKIAQSGESPVVALDHSFLNARATWGGRPAKIGHEETGEIRRSFMLRVGAPPAAAALPAAGAGSGQGGAD